MDARLFFRDQTESEMAAWNATIGSIYEQGKIEVYISFHAYAQKLLSSWAVDFSIIADEPPTLEELQAAGAAASQEKIFHC